MDSVLVVCLDSNLCCILLPKLSFQNRNPFALSITFLKTFKISFAYRINSNLRGGLLIEQLFCFRVGREGIEIRWLIRCFPDGSDSKASVYNAGDLCSIPGLGRSPGEGNSNPLLPGESHRKARWATVHGVAKSQTRLSN